MSTEQSAPDSVDAALAAMDAKLFGPSEEETPQESQQAEENSDDLPDDDSEESTSEPETFDWQAEDGEVVKLPAKIKDAMLTRADYTQKTQQVAELRKMAEDRMQFVEAKEQLSTAVLSEVTELRVLEAELKKYQGADWASLFQSDIGQAANLQRVMGELKDQVATKRGEIQAKAAQIQAATERHNAFQWQKAEEIFRQRVGNITQEENVGMALTVKALGLDEATFKAKHAEPGIIQAIYESSKWRALQSKKGQALQSVNKAAPVVKQGSSTPELAEKMRGLNWSKQMKNASSTKEKVNLAQARMAKFFGS